MPRKGEVVDLTGHRYNSWVVLHLGERQGRRTMWVCRCDCGTTKSVYAGHLRGGASKSCGCNIPRGESHVRFKHGMSDSPEFKTWLQMHTRCYNPNIADWDHYGGRGITICDRWKDDFLAFYRDMGPKPSPDHSIDRIDVERGYEPENCRWATSVEQARNTSRTRWVMWEGRTVSLAEACELAGVNYASAQERLTKGQDWRGASYVA